jgi:hypothetical protein
MGSVVVEQDSDNVVDCSSESGMRQQLSPENFVYFGKRVICPRNPRKYFLENPAAKATSFVSSLDTASFHLSSFLGESANARNACVDAFLYRARVHVVPKVIYCFIR